MPAVMGDGEPGTLWGDTRRPHSAPPAPLPMATWAPPGRDGGTEPAQHRRATKAGALGWGPVRGLSARASTSMPPSRVPEPTAGQRPERDALPPTSPPGLSLLHVPRLPGNGRRSNVQENSVSLARSLFN